MMNNNVFQADDKYWMQQAIRVAQLAQDRGEVPVGALIVKDGTLIAESGNQSIADHDPTAHAEISVMRIAAQSLRNYRLSGSTLYVTLEPCMMCAGAMLHARIQRLVFGAYDFRAGVAGGCFDWLMSEKHMHKMTITGGVYEEDCAQLLKDFFKTKR
jgi:tRNA(adenine34) deaminase